MRLLAFALVVAAAASLASAASARAPVPVTAAFAVPVVCADAGMPDWALASYGSAHVTLRPSLCDAVARAQAGRLQGRVQMGMAALGILMLGHELSHVLGAEDRDVSAAGEDPDEANCAAWRLYPWVVWRLGIGRRLGERLAALVVNVGQPACAKIGA